MTSINKDDDSRRLLIRDEFLIYSQSLSGNAEAK